MEERFICNGCGCVYPIVYNMHNYNCIYCMSNVKDMCVNNSHWTDYGNYEEVRELGLVNFEEYMEKYNILNEYVIGDGLCDYCERHLNGYINISQYDMCEGKYCKEAYINYVREQENRGKTYDRE